MRLAALCLMTCLVSGPIAAQAAHTASRQIWFSPDDETPDLLDLFSRPEEWPLARSRIDVLKLGPQHFEMHSQLKVNTLHDLAEVGAFEKLRTWGIALASEEGAVKEWDCTGKAAAEVTLSHLRNVRALHGEIRLIAMDEPLVSGLGPCKLSVGEVAGRTRRYIEQVRGISREGTPSAAPQVGDIEPYPFFSVRQLRDWLDALTAEQVQLQFFHLDVDLNALGRGPWPAAVRDIRQLQSMLHARHVPFGLIIWSGRDPEPSDESYYRDAMRLVDLAQVATAQPRQIVFESWVRRAGSDKSIPLNLPEAGVNVFSHTRLVNDAFVILRQPAH